MSIFRKSLITVLSVYLSLSVMLQVTAIKCFADIDYGLGQDLYHTTDASQWLQENKTHGLFDNGNVWAEAIGDTKANSFLSDPDIYSFIHLTDTQYYTALAPETYLEQCSFIVRERYNYNIQFVAHTGDIIDCATLSNQWLNAKNGINMLENAEIPRQIVAGNHDLGGTLDYASFLQWFGADTYINNYTDLYALDNGKAIVQVVTVSNGHRWLFVGLGWAPTDEQLRWASAMIAQHTECPAVIMTHDYLDVDGKISTNGKRIGQYLVNPFPNVRLVLCGHNHAYATNVSSYDDDRDGVVDRRVYALLADYQADENKLTGKMRMLTVSEPDNMIYIRTYSTQTGDFVDDDAFVIYMEDDWFSEQ